MTPLRHCDASSRIFCTPRLTAVGQNPRPHNRPVKGAVLDDSFLHTLVIVSAAEKEAERHALKAADACATVASPEASYADQPLDLLALHGAHQNAGRVREEMYRPEHLGKTDAQHLNRNVHAEQSRLDILPIQRVATKFLEDSSPRERYPRPNEPAHVRDGRL